MTNWIKKAWSEMRKIARGEASFDATSFQLMSRVGAETPGGVAKAAVIMRLCHEDIGIVWEMSLAEALEISERLRVSAARASGQLDMVTKSQWGKNVGQA